MDLSFSPTPLIHTARALYHSPVGIITLAETSGKLSGLYFGEMTECSFGQDLPKSDLLYEAEGQLDAYFQGKLRIFSLPLILHGTPFRCKVWRALTDVPYGQTCSYRDIAEAIGQPGACRAVGGANHVNPISIIIPCHRVIAADRSIGGYAEGIKIKQWLLWHEKSRKGSGDE